jgi:hypothetical protein
LSGKYFTIHFKLTVVGIKFDTIHKYAAEAGNLAGRDSGSADTCGYQVATGNEQ